MYAQLSLQFAANSASRQVQTAQYIASSKLSQEHHFAPPGTWCPCERRSTARHGSLAFVAVSASVCYRLDVSLPSSGALHGEVRTVCFIYLSRLSRPRQGSNCTFDCRMSLSTAYARVLQLLGSLCLPDQYLGKVCF